MFNKQQQPLTEILGKTNRIVEGTTIIGDIISSADFRLDGKLQGNFKTKGKIVIGPAGGIKGTINAKNADIEGNFEGKITIEEQLSIKSSAVIIGEVICSKLSVEPGATFTATCEMKPKTETQPITNGKPEEKAK